MIRRAAPADIPALAELLVEAVGQGASIHFRAGLDLPTARDFWERRFGGESVILVATDAAGVTGTVTLGLDTPPNQRHRAEIGKLVVAARAQRQGVAAALMQAAEAEAVAHGRWLLTLDTVAGSTADRLYRRLGWTCDGTIDGFAYAPDGTLTAASLFSKRLAAR